MVWQDRRHQVDATEPDWNVPTYQSGFGVSNNMYLDSLLYRIRTCWTTWYLALLVPPYSGKYAFPNTLVLARQKSIPELFGVR